MVAVSQAKAPVDFKSDELGCTSMTKIDLAGKWEFALDPDGQGTKEGWFATELPGRVVLPGSLDGNNIGEVNKLTDDLSGLSRKVTYTGAAWYSRVVQIPDEWVNRTLSLSFERVHWFSELWINGLYVGGSDSLSVPHDFTLLATDAELRITLCIDNTPKIPIGRIGHALTDWTQTNWNGVIGEMTIELSKSKLDSILLFTDGQKLYGNGLLECSEELEIEIQSHDETRHAAVSVEQSAPVEFELSLEGVSCWSDDNPNLFDVTLRQGEEIATKRLGCRSIKAVGKRFELNNQPLFLRGTLECCVFPKTGYPPMEIEPWLGVLGQAKSFGLNHIRFHSWCPPEAAFRAADQLGLLLQVELPVWTGLWAISSVPSLMDFCRREAYRILSEYGHHPSFTFFALGNEIAFYGPEPLVDELLADLKRDFPSHLYTFSAQGTHLSPVCDFYVQADNGKPGPENRPLRGSTWFGVGSRFDRERPSTLTTCDEAADQFDRPVISHEVAEWAVFPDVYNASKYDGVLEARNLESIARMLEAKGMLDQAPEFVQASGALSAILYKEEIETLLRTNVIAGYQLLGLTDFPGQGTATVGMLDAFWAEKGFITAESFREFCAPTVPLLIYEKSIWSVDERFSAEVRSFHAGVALSTRASWAVRDKNNSKILGGDFGQVMLSHGDQTPIGSIDFDLQPLSAPAKYVLEVSFGNGIENRWPFWVYPHIEARENSPDVTVFSFYREDVREALRQGKKVWLRIDPTKTWSGIPGRFAPAFWSPIHFKEQVGTMGCLIGSEHPMFASFPTESHSNWQWWDVLTHSKAIILDCLPHDFLPTLQVIDRYERNHKLGSIFEATVGQGRLLVTMIDFDNATDRPATKQLEKSLLQYIDSDLFLPEQKLSLRDLDQLFAKEP